MRAETAGGHLDSVCRQSLIEILPDRLGVVRFSGSYEAGAVAAADIAVKGELGDRQNLPLAVEYRPVHLALFVLEDPHIDDLPGCICHLVRTVMIADCHQEQKSLVDLLRSKPCVWPALFVHYVHVTPGNPLNDDSHGYQSKGRRPTMLAGACGGGHPVNRRR